jgi:hypothetical protein
MGRIVERPSFQPRSTSRRQGLRKLSPDLISKARDETATQVTRVGLTFLGTAAFCLLSLLSLRVSRDREHGFRCIVSKYFAGS